MKYVIVFNVCLCKTHTEGILKKSLTLSLFFLPLLQETMPQTPIFSTMLGSSCSGQVQPDMGDRCVDPVYQDGNLVSGSLEALIERLVPTMDYYPDVSSQ